MRARRLTVTIQVEDLGIIRFININEPENTFRFVTDITCQAIFSYVQTLDGYRGVRASVSFH